MLEQANLRMPCHAYIFVSFYMDWGEEIVGRSVYWLKLIIKLRQKSPLLAKIKNNKTLEPLNL